MRSLKKSAGNTPLLAPFTKESLLYRELFEKYYPGQADMVTDFWMPNKAWDGCNVSDPSARVLVQLRCKRTVTAAARPCCFML